MKDSRVVEILKKSILLELKGRALYEKVVDETEDEGIKKIFSIMAEEEDNHAKFLTNQLKYFLENKKFKRVQVDSGAKNVSYAVINENVAGRISAVGFEAAAISAAIDMEKRSIEVYSQRAEEALDEEEKAFYRELADWEKGHLDMLVDLDKDLTEQVWYDNNFWPF